MEVAMSSTSTAHTYGNVVSFMTEYLKGIFPNYFKTVHVTSTMAYREFGKFNSIKGRLIKKSKPMMIIRPRVEINDNSTFLNGTHLTTRMDDKYLTHGMGNLQPFIRNDNDKIYMKYLLNRFKMYLDVIIIVETQMEQINQANYIKNRVTLDYPIMIQTSLESHIPKQMLEIYSQEAGIPMKDENGSIKPFIDHLNGRSHNPITYKLQTSTGNDEFFRYYPVNIMTAFNDLQIDDGSKSNMVDDMYTISFSMPLEFNGAGLYYYFTENRQKIDIKKRINDAEIKYSQEKVIMPLFTISNLYDLPLPEGWTLFGNAVFMLENDGQPEEVDIEFLYNASILDFIDHHVRLGIPIEPFIKIHIMKDNKKLVENRDYAVNEDATKVIIRNTNTASSYRLIIHINTYYINELMKDIHNLRED